LREILSTVVLREWNLVALSFFAATAAKKFAQMGIEGQVVDTPEAIHLTSAKSTSVLTVTKGDIQPATPKAQEPNAPVAKPIRNSTKPAEEDTIYSPDEWSPWGDNDDFPVRLLETLDRLGVMKSALDVNGDMHYGAGPIWVRDEFTEEGKVVRKVVNPAGWRKFLRETGFEVTHGEVVDSLEIFYIAFPEVLLDDQGKVASIKLLDTPRCRFAKRNTNGDITHVAFNVHENVNESKVKWIPIYDPKNPRKFNRFVYPIMYRTLGKIYYPEPNYYATFRAGWADVAISVAKFMKNVYINAMSLKYHLKIPLSSLKAKYKDWDELKMEDQLTKIQEFKELMDTHLAEAENAGKSVYSVFDDSNDFETVQIEPIKSYLDSTKELPNNLAANSEMLFAAGTDPALVGLNNPGGGDLNGSGGSDKRESRKSKQGNLKRERAVSLQLLNLIAYLNGYDEDIYPTYLDTDTSQTMDENPTGKKTVVQ
jgi:hypothetical protein